MLLMPDPDSARMDPFREVNTLILQCNVHEPKTGKDYDRDPRSLGLRAEAYLKSTGIGDTAYFGPEPEFFIFDSVRWEELLRNRQRRRSLGDRSQDGRRQPRLP